MPNQRQVFKRAVIDTSMIDNPVAKSFFTPPNGWNDHVVSIDSIGEGEHTDGNDAIIHVKDYDDRHSQGIQIEVNPWTDSSTASKFISELSVYKKFVFSKAARLGRNIFVIWVPRQLILEDDGGRLKPTSYKDNIVLNHLYNIARGA